MIMNKNKNDFYLYNSKDIRKMKSVESDVCFLIRDLFFGDNKGKDTECSEKERLSDDPDWNAIYTELNDQEIQLLFSDYLISQNLPSDVRERWIGKCVDKFEINIRILYVLEWLNELLNRHHIPYMVIKGFSASLLYPRPILRNQGDIDVIVPSEFYKRAIRLLNQADCDGEYLEIESSRECAYKKDDIYIEIHSRFATLNTLEAERLLDRWIYEAIPGRLQYQSIYDILPQDIAAKKNRVSDCSYSEQIQSPDMCFPVPPDFLNGLILLTHINQHIEEGLGFRQVIDWMLFVNRFLNDDRWEAFRDNVVILGLERLAITVTRMCQIYFGLPEQSRTWPQVADEQLCEELLQYLFECGNFGSKQGIRNEAAMVISHGRGIIAFFGNLQRRGIVNWALCRKYPIMQPFAWIYQGIRYARFALCRKNGLSLLRKEIQAGRRRGNLADRLEATSQARKK